MARCFRNHEDLPPNLHSLTHAPSRAYLQPSWQSEYDTILDVTQPPQIESGDKIKHTWAHTQTSFMQMGEYI